MLARLLREPIVHFFGFGAVIFGAFVLLDSGEAPAHARDNEIVIDQAQVDHLTRLWKLRWRRDPAPDDLAAIIDRHLRQEVFYREALKLNLDHNDGIIRKRLAQKMEAVANDLSTLMKPATDERLRAYFHSREDFFTLPAAYAFRQVLFLPDEDNVEARMDKLKGELSEGGAIPVSRRSKLSVANYWSLTPVTRLDNAFGREFASSLETLPEGEWAGPVRSGYGWHLVRVERQQPSMVPPFEEVREFVAREYEYQSVLQAQDQVYRNLLAKYEVNITADDVPADVREELSLQ
jgi:peptidyl-prolyl cis-trans isomerase C